MDKLTTYTEYGVPIQELDLGALASIPLTYSIAEARKIGDKKGNFSKTIKLPGTNTNKQYFDGLFDVNTKYGSFNPNVKEYVKLVSNESELMSGYMKLVDLTTDDDGDIEYSVLIVDTGVTLWSKMGNKTVVKNTDPLDDPNLVQITHEWNVSNIENSWDSDWNAGTVQQVDYPAGSNISLHGGIFYPLLNGVGLNGLVDVSEMYPAVFHKYLLNQVLLDNGYTWSGTLKTDPIYEREVIPRVTGPSGNAVSPFKVGIPVSFSLPFTPTDTGIYTVPALVTAPVQTAFSNETDFNGYYDDGDVFDLGLFSTVAAGSYSFNINVQAAIEVKLKKVGNASAYSAVYHKTQMQLRYTVYNSLNVDVSNYSIGIGNTADNEFPVDNSLATNTIVTMEHANTSVPAVVGAYYTTPDIDVPEGGSVRFAVVPFSSAGSRRNNNAAAFVVNDYETEELNINLAFGSYIELSGNTVAGSIPGSILRAENFIDPKLKQIDLLKDVMARYNVYLYSDPEIPNHIILDTGSTFLDGSLDDALDWSLKKDPHTPDKLVHASEVAKKELMLTYTAAKDTTNEGYTDLTNDVWGEYRYEFDNDFINGSESITTPFEPTPNVQNSSGYVVPAITLNDTKVKNRVLYATKGGTSFAPSGSFFDQAYTFIISTTLFGTTTSNTQTVYPYAGHVADPKAPAGVIDLNFGATATTLLPQTTSPSTNTAESRHWRNRINQLASGKLLVTRFDLDSYDVLQIRRQPNLKIWVNNAYWFVNKLTFEGNSAVRGLAKVELVTVENTEQGTPVTPGGGGVVIGGGGGGADPGGGAGVVTNPSTTVIGKTVFNYDVRGDYNVIENSTRNVTVSGDNNTVRTGSKDVSITNSKNVDVTGSNVTVVGSSNLKITSDNVTVINDVLYEGDIRVPLFNVLDGGENELRVANSPFSINTVDAGLNQNLNLFKPSTIGSITGDGTETFTI